MKNFIQQGDHLDIVAGADLTSGQGLLTGQIFGVVQGDTLTGATAVLVRKGVFEMPKTSAQAWTVGARIYWDDTNEVCTTTASGNTLIGAAVEAAANPSDTGIVLLDGTIR